LVGGSYSRPVLSVAALSADTLAQAFEQSTDCVKLIGLGGEVLWMNANGLCAMEIDDANLVCGLGWDQLWPAEARHLVTDSLPAASNGETVRFDAFCPTAKGSPRWWNVTVTGVKNQDGMPAGYLAISRDITVTETQRQALLIAAEEMRHRLKNTYAMIGGLIHGFAKGNGENENFAKDMQKRLISLSSAQSLFLTSDAPCDLSVLVPALVAPFSSSHCPVAIDCAAGILLSQGQADAIALVLGELAVNSTKHGALSAGGAISVTTKLSDAAVSLFWEEKSARPVAAQTRVGGQGLALIERIVRARQGSLEIDWATNGLLVSLNFDRRIN
jgi:two-component sensor histidine kinase